MALSGKTILIQAVGTPEDYQRAFTTLRRLGAEVVVSDDDQSASGGSNLSSSWRWHAARAVGRAVHNPPWRTRRSGSGGRGSSSA